MQILREAIQARPRLHLVPLAMAAIGLSIAMINHLGSEPEPAAINEIHVADSVPAAGPGTWPQSRLRIAPDDPGLAVTESHTLVVNTALRDLIYFFLLERADGDRADQLKLYLKSKLPEPASAEAVHIAEQAEAYIKAHDDMLSAQNVGALSMGPNAVDILRISVWRQQRDRLRQSLLGEQVVGAWYANDDAQLDQVLDEWEQRAEAELGIVSAASGQRDPLPQWQNKKDEEYHRRYMLAVLEKSVTSFAALGHEYRQWTDRYAAYLNEAKRITQNVAIDASQRSRQLQELREKSFATDAERQRARELGP
jgi:lipase chaperone LimK